MAQPDGLVRQEKRGRVDVGVGVKVVVGVNVGDLVGLEEIVEVMVGDAEGLEVKVGKFR